MKIVFMGTPDFSVPCLRALIESKHEVVGVICQPDKPVGRKQILTPPPVKTEALSHGLRVLQPTTLRNGAGRAILEELQPDLVIVVAYGKILPPDFLSYPKYGCVNVHASLLPRYRGASPIHWAILNGDSETGVSTMQMDEGMDTGDVLAESRVPVDAHNAEELFDILSVKGADLIAETLAKIEAGEQITAVPQEDAFATYAPMITKKDGLLDFGRPAAELERRVRGLYPWPGTYTYLDGQPFKIWTAGLAEGTPGAAPGTVLRADREGILIACGEGALLAKEVQAPGKKRMVADAYLKGHSIEKGTVLG